MQYKFHAKAEMTVEERVYPVVFQCIKNVKIFYLILFPKEYCLQLAYLLVYAVSAPKQQ